MISPRLLALTGAISLAAAPAFAANAVSGQVTANASAAVVNSFAGLPGTVSSQSQTFTGAPGNIRAIAFVDVHNVGAGDSAAASTSTLASWDSANRGTVAFVSNLREAAFDPIPGIVVQATTIDHTLDHSGPAWSYAFDATGNDNLFSLNGGAGVSGDFPGLGVWFVSVTEDGQAIVPLDNLTNGTGLSVFSQPLLAGHRYQVSLINEDGNAFVTDGLGTVRFVGDQSSNFSWTITGQAATGGVPEPSTWALAIVGFGLTGAALRRQAAQRPA